MPICLCKLLHQNALLCCSQRKTPPRGGVFVFFEQFDCCVVRWQTCFATVAHCHAVFVVRNVCKREFFHTRGGTFAVFATLHSQSTQFALYALPTTFSTHGVGFLAKWQFYKFKIFSTLSTTKRKDSSSNGERRSHSSISSTKDFVPPKSKNLLYLAKVALKSC